MNPAAGRVAHLDELGEGRESVSDTGSLRGVRGGQLQSEGKPGLEVCDRHRQCGIAVGLEQLPKSSALLAEVSWHGAVLVLKSLASLAVVHHRQLGLQVCCRHDCRAAESRTCAPAF